VTGDWRKLRNKELYNPYFSPSIIKTIKSKRMRRAGHVATNGGEAEECIEDICGIFGRKETTRNTNS
jgi:hypothetical protein